MKYDYSCVPEQKDDDGKNSLDRAADAIEILLSKTQSYRWFSVDELLPEDCTHCYFYEDSNIKFTTVLTMDKNGRIEIKNRLKVKEMGGLNLDEYGTDVWEWSHGGIEPKYWFPIPKNDKL